MLNLNILYRHFQSSKVFVSIRIKKDPGIYTPVVDVRLSLYHNGAGLSNYSQPYRSQCRCTMSEYFLRPATHSGSVQRQQLKSSSKVIALAPCSHIKASISRMLRKTRFPSLFGISQENRSFQDTIVLLPLLLLFRVSMYYIVILVRGQYLFFKFMESLSY